MPGRPHQQLAFCVRLVELLRAHRVEQNQERDTAAQLWTDGDWMFATPTGGPLNPRTDWDDWKKLLARAGVRDGRLHDAQHTAATVRVGGLIWQVNEGSADGK